MSHLHNTYVLQFHEIFHSNFQFRGAFHRLINLRKEKALERHKWTRVRKKGGSARTAIRGRNREKDHQQLKILNCPVYRMGNLNTRAAAHLSARERIVFRDGNGW